VAVLLVSVLLFRGLSRTVLITEAGREVEVPGGFLR